MNKDNLYLKRAKLSGYKSIIDTDISFKDGLNIIIGKNAAGKTNFLKFLFEVLHFSFNDLLDFSSELSFEGSQKLQINSSIKFKNDVSGDYRHISKSEVSTDIIIDDKRIQITTPQENTTPLKDHNISFVSGLIMHGIPNNYHCIDTPFSFKIDSTGFPLNVIPIIFNTDTPYFIKTILTKFVVSIIGLRSNNQERYPEPKEVKKILVDSFKEINTIKNLLTKYSPIENIRLHKNINIFLDENGGNYSINNLFIEFKVQGSWHPFENLSDGTKRLFYIISEVGISSKLYSTSSSFGFNEEENKRIILIEEPELGIHPHQLMALMKFLKIQSQTKQIIITSHSPIILDVLNEDELDRIIVASMTDKKEGTVLKHIGEAEKAKAKKYMQEDYLSDYWKYSDLEK